MTIPDKSRYIVGYSDQISVAPGDKINFMVSAEGARRYKVDIVRTICGDRNPEGPGFKEKVVRTPVSGKSFAARKQPTYPGSYVRVAPSAAVDQLTSFTLQAMIWPTTPGKGMQSIISKRSMTDRGGFGLVIDDQGAIALGLGDGKGRAELITSGKPLVARHWYFVAASYDAKTKQVCVYQEPLIEYPRVDTTAAVREKSRLASVGGASAPLMMAAWHERQSKSRVIAGGLFNGKIDSPRLAARALGRTEMEALKQRTVPTGLRAATVAAWDFSRETSTTRVVDTSANGIHGEVVNMPARAMTGYNWTGRETSWRSAPDQYGAIHFHDDDLYDCGWDVDFSLTIPKSMRSGIYAARVTAGDLVDRIAFFVRPPPGTATAKIAVLMSTACYMAYGNINALYWRNAELLIGRLIILRPDNFVMDYHPEWAASLYDMHTDQSGVCYSSRLRPLLNMKPTASSAWGGHGSSLREFNADTRLIDWLEAKGFEHDIITDEDLHYEGLELLDRYKVVITCSHPEYYSTNMWEAVRTYTDRGGRLMYLGGNGFYWRIAYHETLPGVIEVRRGGPAIRAWAAEPGEIHHSFDGHHGGLWRNQGRAPQSIAGVGFVSEGFDRGAYYLRSPDSNNPRARFIFEGISEDEPIGNFGLEGGGAASIEIDRADTRLGTPPHALVVASSVDHTESYLLVTEEVDIMVPNVQGDNNEAIRADIVFYETPNGGAVFTTGSIGWTGSLSHNKNSNNVSRMTANVLARFVNDKPL